jgi:hypothetical protein
MHDDADADAGKDEAAFGPQRQGLRRHREQRHWKNDRIGRLSRGQASLNLGNDIERELHLMAGRAFELRTESPQWSLGSCAAE